MRKTSPVARVRAAFDMETVDEEINAASTILNGVKYSKVATGRVDSHVSFPCVLNVVCTIMGVALVVLAVIFLSMVYAEHYEPMGNGTNTGG